MMMPVRFAIGGDVYELFPLAAIIKCSGQSLGEFFAAGQQALKCDRLRYRAIIKEDRQRAAGTQLHEIGTCRIDLTAINIPPVALAHFADATRLKWGKNRELEAALRQCVERLCI